jgi:hypothetical protein
MSEGITMKNKIDAIRLISFSPVTGVAFFESDGKMCEIDITSGKIESYEDEEKDIALHSMVVEYGQQPSDKEFRTKEELKKYVKTAYLRDKKATYHRLLLEEELGPALRKQILHRLNQETMASLDFPPGSLEDLASQTVERLRKERQRIGSTPIPLIPLHEYVQQLADGIGVSLEPVLEYFNIIEDFSRSNPGSIRGIVNLAKELDFSEQEIKIAVSLDLTSPDDWPIRSDFGLDMYERTLSVTEFHYDSAAREILAEVAIEARFRSGRLVAA